MPVRGARGTKNSIPTPTVCRSRCSDKEKLFTRNQLWKAVEVLALGGSKNSGTDVNAGVPYDVFLWNVLLDLGLLKPGPSVMWSDSKSAVDMSFDPVAFKNTKHITRSAEFLRDLVARDAVVLRHVPGRIMIADMLTKAVSRSLYLELLRLFDAYATDGIVCPA